MSPLIFPCGLARHVPFKAFAPHDAQNGAAGKSVFFTSLIGIEQRSVPMLILTRKSHEQIQIGDNITITILRAKGKGVQVGIDAPRNVTVLRKELCYKQRDAGETATGDEMPNHTDDAPLASVVGRSTARLQGGKRQTTASQAAANPMRSRLSSVAAAPLTRYMAHQ
jgi:carbon storage regulator